MVLPNLSFSFISTSNSPASPNSASPPYPHGHQPIKAISLSSGWCSSLLTGHFACTLVPSFLFSTQAARVAIWSHKLHHVTFSPLKSFSALPSHFRIKFRLIAIPTRQDPSLRFLWPQGLWPYFLSLSHHLLPSTYLPDGFLCLFLPPEYLYLFFQILSPCGWFLHGLGLFLNMLSSLGLSLICSPSLLSTKTCWFISP